jgi:hypothetical protein
MLGVVCWCVEFGYKILRWGKNRNRGKYLYLYGTISPPEKKPKPSFITWVNVDIHQCIQISKYYHLHFTIVTRYVEARWMSRVIRIVMKSL